VIYVPPSGTHDLAWTLEELRGILPEPRVSVAGPHDLVIFLRSIECARQPGMRRHLIVVCPDDGSRSRLRRWLARRPGFDSEIVTDNASWQAAVDNFLRRWGSLRLAPASFRSIGRFTEALARFAADPSSPSAAFTWVAP
jgi:hypothetical protein